MGAVSADATSVFLEAIVRNIGILFVHRVVDLKLYMFLTRGGSYPPLV